MTLPAQQQRPKYRGTLELTWTNKDETLLAHEDGSYEWVNPANYHVSEVRLLHEVATVGEVTTEGIRDNLLIRGDSLHALTSLNRLPGLADQYVGRVKLVYIDPPFNTGQAFEHYDDNLEHSVWLTMFRDRLIQIKSLLTQDGSVWVHLDDSESHRARCVLDEILGIENFAAEIVWEKDKGRRNDTHISSVHDYILVYANSLGQFKKSRNLLSRTASHDARYRNPDNDPRGPWLQGDNGTAKSGSEKDRFKVTLPSGRTVTPPKGNYWRFTPESLEAARHDGRVWFGRKGDSLPVIKRYLTDVQQGLVPRSWWSADEVGTNQDAKRDHLRRMFPDIEPFATPKPETLMQRIIHISTNPGDVVLDCFAGSGTTAATAHKMGRRWVTVERSTSTLADYTLPRLTKVVNNEDPGGITSFDAPVGDGLPDGFIPGSARAAAKLLEALMKNGIQEDLVVVSDDALDELVKALRLLEKTKREVLWSGGGGFRVLDVGPSMFQAIGDQVFLSEWAVNGKLAEAVAAQLGYVYEAIEPFCGVKGRRRLAVVDGLVNASVAGLVLDALPSGQTVALYGTAIDPDARDVLRTLRKGSTLSKIPSALLSEYRRGSQFRSNLTERLAEGPGGVE